LAALDKLAKRSLNDAVPHAASMLTNDRASEVRSIAATILARSRKDLALDALFKAVDDPNSLSREPALEALAKSVHPDRDARIVARIETALQPGANQDHHLVYDLVRALRDCRDAATHRALISIYHREQTPGIRGEIIFTLRYANEPDWLDELGRIIDSKDTFSRANAKSTLVWHGGAIAYDRLHKLFAPEKLKTDQGRAEAKDLLISLWVHDDRPGGGKPPLQNDSRWVDVATSVLEYESLAHDALILLEQHRDPSAVDALLEHVRNKGSNWRQAVTVLGVTRDRRATPLLSELLESADGDSFWCLCNALGEIRDRAALPALRARASRPDLSREQLKMFKQAIQRIERSKR
jgi:HEAT repeat protein